MNPVIEVRNLSYTYPDGKKALEGIDLKIMKGECVGIVGPNGSGKSTLLLHLNGILPDKETKDPMVYVGGVPVNAKNAQVIRRKVGLLFQDSDDQLFCPTVLEDVSFGPVQFGLSDGEVRKLVRESLDKVGLKDYENRMPHHLSGGEKQRVSLAGVLACEPDVLALDEPTSSLDPRGKRRLKELLKSIQAIKIIATHDLEMVVELCQRTVILDRGKIVADGPTVELLSDEDLVLAHGLEKPHILRHSHPH